MIVSMPGKPTLTPPAGPRPPRRDSGASRLKVASVIAVLLLVVIALGVVVILPGQLAPEGNRDTTLTGTPEAPEPPPANQSSAPAWPAPELKDPATATPPSVPGQESTAGTGSTVTTGGKVAAQRLLREALRIQARLDNSGARIWGAEKQLTSYPEAQQQLAAGDAFFAAEQFDSAAVAYQGAIERFQQLDAGRPERLRRTLEAGAAALERLDATAAAAAFETGLSIEPGNRVAQDGLERARRLPEVLGRYQKAQTFEAQGELEPARDAFKKALALDSEFQAAREGLARTTTAIETLEYQQALSEASAALDDQQYTRSGRALARAQKLRPDAPELDDLGRRLRAAKTRVKVNTLRRQAGRQARNEQWAKAIKSYEQLLKIDKTLGFALDGKTRAEQHLELNRQIDQYLTNPERLASPDPLRNARKLLKAANGLSNGAPGLAAKLTRLGALIETATQPVPVILQSDGETQVVVYRVGKFGRFKERRLRLLPGEYTAVGSRRGYRDVRIRFKVSATQREIIVVVRSEELI